MVFGLANKRLGKLRLAGPEKCRRQLLDFTGHIGINIASQGFRRLDGVSPHQRDR